MEKLRLNFTLMEALDRDYGERLPNGDWSGAIGCVTRKEADIATGHLIFTRERSQAVSILIFLLVLKFFCNVV
jgi:hypothetical protein